MAVERAVGKCEENHPGSYGYPTRPDNAYPFCSQCGKAMVWECPNCQAQLPEDSSELLLARFCRECGTPYCSSDSTPSARARSS